MKRCAVFVLLFFLASCASPTAPIVGGASTTASTLFVGREVSNIIDKIHGTGQTLIRNAETSGNALISRAGNEVYIIEQNLSMMLKDNMDMLFDDLDEQRQLLVIESYRLTNELAATMDKAYEIKETTALDLNALISKVPFVRDEFFIQSIKGLAYLPQMNDFRVQVLATHLGIQERYSSRIEAYIGHGEEAKIINDTRTDMSAHKNAASIYIPNKALQKYYKQKELNIVPVQLKVLITEHKSFLGVKWDSEKTHFADIFISLYPQVAGTVVAEFMIPEFDWVMTRKLSETTWSPNQHCSNGRHSWPDKRCRTGRYATNSATLSVAGGPRPPKVGSKKLENISYGCVGGNCNYIGSSHLSVDPDKTRATFTWTANSTPGAYQVRADLYEYQLINEVAAVSPSHNIRFNKILNFIVRKGWNYGELKIITYTKQEYSILIGQSDQNNLLVYKKRSDAGPGKERITYMVNSPRIQ